MNALTLIAAALLFLHGLIHLLGTAVYTRLGSVQRLPFKTTLLGGRWDVGVGGIGVFGALWAVAALGFVASALALGFGWAHWRALLLGTTLLSLVLTAFDWRVAPAGLVLNLIILALLWLGPSLALVTFR